MKFLMRYSPAMIFIIYGILLKEGLYSSSRGTGNGLGFIIVGLLLLFFTLYMEYLELKDDNITNKTEENKKPIDYFCALFLVFGLIYFGLFLFEVVTNYFIFIVIVLSFAICGKSVRKFIY